MDKWGTIHKVAAKNPIANFNYMVTISHRKLGNINCGFNFISGIGVSAVFEEYREGGNNKTPDLLLESISTQPLTFSKGLTSDESIYDIANLTFSTLNGVTSAFDNHFTVEVSARDKHQNVIQYFSMRNCVVESVLLGDLNALGNEILLESIVFRYTEVIKR